MFEATMSRLRGLTLDDAHAIRVREEHGDGAADLDRIFVTLSRGTLDGAGRQAALGITRSWPRCLRRSDDETRDLRGSVWLAVFAYCMGEVLKHELPPEEIALMQEPWVGSVGATEG
jgi:hypothetical protein